MKKKLLKKLPVFIITIITFFTMAKPGTAQEIIKPSGIFQIQKMSPEEIKASVHKPASNKEFEVEERRSFKQRGKFGIAIE